MDWLPTLLAAAGAPDYSATDGINLLPLLKGEQAPQLRKLFWRYKAQGQRAVRDGEYKYLRIKGRDFLFNVLREPRERANLAGLEPARLAALRADWEAWNSTMLPITPEVYTHWCRAISRPIATVWMTPSRASRALGQPRCKAASNSYERSPCARVMHRAGNDELVRSGAGLGGAQGGAHCDGRAYDGLGQHASNAGLLGRVPAARPMLSTGARGKGPR